MPAQLLRSIRLWLALFILGLMLSGLTAFPLDHELAWLATFTTQHPFLPQAVTGWVTRVHQALADTNTHYPFLAYGTDWLAFAHIVLAILFIGPFVDPVRNKWIITFGLIACAGVFPLALIAGHLRGIPLGWRLIDCSFGVFGAIPLLLCRRLIRVLESRQATQATNRAVQIGI